MSVLYRPHRGGLAEAMSEVRKVETLQEIFNFSNLEEYGFKSSEMRINYYCYDDRIKWKTYIITCLNYGVIGFTNGEIK